MKFFTHGNVPSTVSTRSAYVDHRRPDNKGNFESFKIYVYNPDEGTFCNRTCMSWCYVIVFYMLFLIIGAGIFAAFTLGTVAVIRHVSGNTSIVDISKLKYKEM